MKTQSVRILVLSVVVFVGVFAARAQEQTNSEINSLRQEMEQMRRDDEQRIQSLEQRLQELEKTSKSAAPTNQTAAPAATNATLAAAERAQAFAKKEFSETTDSIGWSLSYETNGPVMQRVEQVLNDFIDTAGYVRAGYGRDSEGAPQVPFQAPNAFAKYRLGNETEDYAELMLGKNWYGPNAFSLDPDKRADSAPNGPVARTQVRLGFYDPYSDGTGGFQVSLPEAWASIANVVASQPTLQVWAGNRFYRRQDICINDFFFYNMSGAGAGVDDVQLPFGKAAIAWIGNGEQSGIYSSDIAALPDPNNLAGFSKQSFDFSLYELPMPWGQGEIGIIYALENGGTTEAGLQAPDSHGVSFNFIHRHEHFISQDGFNRISVQFGTGAAKTFTSGYETVTATNGTFIVPDQPGSWRFRVTENFVAQPAKWFSISPALVYQYTEYNNSQGVVQWFSAGARPIYHFNEFFNVAFEGGVDYTTDTGTSQNGMLYKLTLAPQIALGRGFFSRPVLRGYVTYAGWSNSFKGSVGGIDYVDQTHGWSWGAQMETWW
jgi:maltoporin